ncbi:10448_t:CDS:2 [Gigaspora margarita]|uniref:10448_t:CDS:1 n=1 Tax=Gigaspora margarita TaxID=4874 RepID=A0ABN7VCB8_GIGMA|nr:10448_t:CDS:2 [Gigaspora margarita]
MSDKAPTSIGSYGNALDDLAIYPNNMKIPSNFTIPDGNVFKLYLAGFVWYICNTNSNNKWEVAGQFIVRSAIPEYDDSAMIVTPIGVAPSSDPMKNSPSELNLVLSTSGNGAFSNITYLILTDTDGGVAPPSSECK